MATRMSLGNHIEPDTINGVNVVENQQDFSTQTYNRLTEAFPAINGNLKMMKRGQLEQENGRVYGSREMLI